VVELLREVRHRMHLAGWTCWRRGAASLQVCAWQAGEPGSPTGDPPPYEAPHLHFQHNHGCASLHVQLPGERVAVQDERVQVAAILAQVGEGADLFVGRGG